MIHLIVLTSPLTSLILSIMVDPWAVNLSYITWLCNVCMYVVCVFVCCMCVYMFVMCVYVCCMCVFVLCVLVYVFVLYVCVCVYVCMCLFCTRVCMCLFCVCTCVYHRCIHTSSEGTHRIKHITRQCYTTHHHLLIKCHLVVQ